ncbi:hypothetical protein MTO96_008923 [Rhipicephalus appendiculatus]
MTHMGSRADTSRAGTVPLSEARSMALFSMSALAPEYHPIPTVGEKGRTRANVAAAAAALRSGSSPGRAAAVD